MRAQGHLEPEELEALRALAHRRGVSLSHEVREVFRAALGLDPDRDEKGKRFLAAAGAAKEPDERRDVAHEACLVVGFAKAWSLLAPAPRPAARRRRQLADGRPRWSIAGALGWVVVLPGRGVATAGHARPADCRPTSPGASPAGPARSPVLPAIEWTSGQRSGRFDSFACLGILQEPSEEVRTGARPSFEWRDPGARAWRGTCSASRAAGARDGRLHAEGDQDRP